MHKSKLIYNCFITFWFDPDGVCLSMSMRVELRKCFTSELVRFKLYVDDYLIILFSVMIRF